MSPKDRRFNFQLDLVRAALKDDPRGLTWGELQSRLEDLATERTAKAARKLPDLGAISDAKRKKWLREKAGRWSAKEPTPSQLRELLAVLVGGHEVRVKPKRGPGTPKTRYVSVAAEVWWRELKGFLDALGGKARMEELPLVDLSGVVADLPVLSREAGIGIAPESEDRDRRRR